MRAACVEGEVARDACPRCAHAVGNVVVRLVCGDLDQAGQVAPVVHHPQPRAVGDRQRDPARFLDRLPPRCAVVARLPRVHAEDGGAPRQVEAQHPAIRQLYELRPHVKICEAVSQEGVIRDQHLCGGRRLRGGALAPDLRRGSRCLPHIGDQKAAVLKGERVRLGIGEGRGLKAHPREAGRQPGRHPPPLCAAVCLCPTDLTCSRPRQRGSGAAHLQPPLSVAAACRPARRVGRPGVDLHPGARGGFGDGRAIGRPRLRGRADPVRFADPGVMQQQAAYRGGDDFSHWNLWSKGLPDRRRAGRSDPGGGRDAARCSQ